MLNYDKLMAHKPTVFESITNSIGQKIDLVEHPTMGDESSIICVCHELKLAQASGFFDTDELAEQGGDYEPRFVDGKLRMNYEFM